MWLVGCVASAAPLPTVSSFTQRTVYATAISKFGAWFRVDGCTLEPCGVLWLWPSGQFIVQVTDGTVRTLTV